MITVAEVGEKLWWCPSHRTILEEVEAKGWIQSHRNGKTETGNGSMGKYMWQNWCDMIEMGVETWNRVMNIVMEAQKHYGR